MLVALIGLVVGVAVGTTGVGAGILTVPLLVMLAGNSAVDSVGAALLFSTVIKIVATVQYQLRRQVNWKTLGWLSLGGVPGVLAGSLFLKELNEKSLHYALVGVGAIVTLSACLSLAQSWRSGENGKWRLKPLGGISFLLGIQVGFSSSGAGALGCIALFHCTPLSTAAVVGTDLAYGLILSATGGLMHVAFTGWQTALLIQLLVGGIVGVLAGTYIAKTVPTRRLRQAILIWAGILGAIMVYRTL
jgi:uncharacterized protein